MKRRLQQIDESIERYLGQIASADRQERATASGSGMVGYNVQTAVDAKHHLIVAHEVTNIGTDRSQLHNMASQAIYRDHRHSGM